MKNLLSVALVALLTISSISLAGCCCNPPQQGHHHHKHHDHSKMHHEHGDK